MDERLSYKKAGVDIDAAEAAKRRMARAINTDDARVLNRLGAFASLFDGRFTGYEHPVLVLKMEEPGSKQKLAAEHGRLPSIAYDLVHHLINDIIVMGAEPLAVLDCIICGHLEKDIAAELVENMADACRQQGCSVVGGETSEQPGVVDRGTYIFTASIVGVVEKSKVIDGSKISEGDVVLAAASNGLHTNGYSLVRALIAEKPEILDTEVEGESFLEAILRPHKCYYQAFKGLFDLPGLHGIAHITSGGIAGNLDRILPEGAGTAIDLSAVRVLPVFRVIRDAGGIKDTDMLRPFNLGVGMTIVAAPETAENIQSDLGAHDCRCYPIGHVVRGSGQVLLERALNWR